MNNLNKNDEVIGFLRNNNYPPRYNDGLLKFLRAYFNKTYSTISDLTTRYNNMIKARFFKTSTPGTIDISPDAVTGTDISAVLEAAANDLPSNGGVILIPEGTFYVENVEVKPNIKYVGVGSESTILELPADATNPMFNCTDAGTNLESTGWYYLQLKGIGTSGPNGIDLSTAPKWEFGGVEECRIRNFARGLVGTQNDRRPYIRYSQFWYNDEGIYVNGNHPQLISCDIRSNRIGLSGSTLYDMQIDNCVFAYNTHGILPEDGSIQQTIISNCQFFSNDDSAATVNQRVIFNNCLLVAGNTTNGVDSFGVKFLDPNSGWVGGVVSEEGASNEFADAAFVIEADDICINNTKFICSNFVRANNSSLKRHIISGNNGFCSGYFAKFTQGGVGCQGVTISYNTIDVDSTNTSLSAGEGVIETSAVNYSIGVKIVGNVIQSRVAGHPADAIRADLRSGICTLNHTRRISAIVATSTNANTINTNNIESP